MKIPAKFFPFAARQPLWDMAKKYGKQKYSIVAIWDYMFWRSGKKNLFELADDIVCLDLGCDTHTLCGVRKVLQAEGWLKKESLRDKGGKWLTRGWTVKINLASTCTKSPSSEDQPHGHEPHGHEPHVDVPHAEEPHVVNYTALYPPSSGTLQHSEPTVSCYPPFSVSINELTDQLVASSESEEETTSAPTPGLEAEDKTNPESEPSWTSPSGIVYGWKDILLHMGACWSAFKRVATPTPEEVKLFTEILAVCDDNDCYPEDAIGWAQKHILNPKLLGGLRSVKGVHRAVCGEGVSSTNGLLAQYKDHLKNPKACGICAKACQGINCSVPGCKNWVELTYDGEPSEYCNQCAKLDSTDPRKGQTRSMCACGKGCKGFCPVEVAFEESCMSNGKVTREEIDFVEGDEPIAVGKGFDIEEAE